MAEWSVFFRLRTSLFISKFGRDGWLGLISTTLTLLPWLVLALVLFGLAQSLPPSVRPLVDQVLATSAIVAPLFWGLLSGLTGEGSQSVSSLGIIRQGAWAKLTVTLALPLIMSVVILFPFLLGSWVDLGLTPLTKSVGLVAILSLEIGLTTIGFALAWLIKFIGRQLLVRLFLVAIALWAIWYSTTTALPSLLTLSLTLGVTNQLTELLIIGLGCIGMSVTVIEAIENSVFSARHQRKLIKYWSVLTSARALTSSFNWFDSLFVVSLLNLVRNNAIHRQLILPFIFLIFGLPLLNALSPLDSTTTLIASSLLFILLGSIVSRGSGKIWLETMEKFRHTPALRPSSWWAVYLASLSVILVIGILFIGYIASFSLALDLNAKVLLLVLLMATHSLYFYFGSVEVARNVSASSRKLMAILAVALVFSVVTVMAVLSGAVSLFSVLIVSLIWLIAYGLILKWLMPINSQLI